MGHFENFAKGPPFAFWPKPAILSILWKNCHFLADTHYFWALLVSIQTRINFASIHINYAKIWLVFLIFWSFRSSAKKIGHFENFRKGPPFAFWPKSAILSTLWKNCHFSANTHYFWALLISLETRINSASIHTNKAKIGLVFSYFLKLPKFSQRNRPFWEFCKGSPLCNLAKIGHFEYLLKKLPFLS